MPSPEGYRKALRLMKQAQFCGEPVTVIAQEKGTTTKENIARNFGMPSPEGYRKALRLMKQAEKFHRPVLCFVDTPGAFCGLEAEERGQGEAIARNIYEMSALKLMKQAEKFHRPVLCFVDTPGAFCGLEAEERGQGEAIARNIYEMSALKLPIHSVIIGEGEAAVHLHWRQQRRCGCWKIQSTRSYHRKGLHQFCGKTVSGQIKQRKLCD